MSVVWLIYCGLIAAVGFVVIAKWSVLKMTREINRQAEPEKRMSLWWWPNYKDRRGWRMYGTIQPHDLLRFVYPACFVAALLSFAAAVFAAVHAPGVQ